MSAIQISPDFLKEVDHYIDSQAELVRSIRRYLHRHPEPSGSEFKTTAYLKDFFEDRGLAHRIGPQGRGLVVDSDFEAPLPRYAIRADIDALRLQDEKTVSYRSQELNLMHACGHDGHTAMVLGATIALEYCRQKMDTPVVWRSIFQPSEESATGALEMVEAGAIEGVSAILALHVDPTYAVGEIAYRHGALTACCQEFNITVEGEGGHGARPHTTCDPVAAAAQLVHALYAQIPRSVDAREPAVISVGVINGGINPNVIPETVQIRGTLRTIADGADVAIRQRIREVADGIERCCRVRVRIEYPYVLNSVLNDFRITELCRSVSRDIVGTQNVLNIESPSMGGEDFANYLRHVPGCMLRLGVGFPDSVARHLHSNRFDIDERALPIGTKLLVRSVLAMHAENYGRPAPSS